MGRPVLATAVGGAVEIIHSPEVGVLVPPRDPSSLIEGIIQLSDDEALRWRLGRCGQSMAREKFDRRRTNDVMTELFESML